MTPSPAPDSGSPDLAEPQILRDLRRAQQLIAELSYLPTPTHPAYATLLRIREANPGQDVMIVAAPDLAERLRAVPLPTWVTVHFDAAVPAGQAYAFPAPEYRS